MSLETVTAGLREKVGSDCGLGASVKFDFGDDGCLFLDATQSPNVINNDDADDYVHVSPLHGFNFLTAGYTAGHRRRVS